MEIAQLIGGLAREGELLSDAADRTDLEAPVPTCPGWRMRDLVRHVGGVHRWATTYVARSRSEPMDEDEEHAVMDTWPDDGGLVGWFREGHATLVRTLEEASPDVSCWSFLPAPSPLAFWARRQAHETGIHRADAEGPGGTITPFPPAFAADGIDELLTGFVARPGGGLVADPARTVQVHCSDAQGDWLVQIGPDGVAVSRENGASDCTVVGSASDLYMLLWNRRTPEGLDVRGDRSLIDLWRETVHIRWS